MERAMTDPVPVTIFLHCARMGQLSLIHLSARVEYSNGAKAASSLVKLPQYTRTPALVADELRALADWIEHTAANPTSLPAGPPADIPLPNEPGPEIQNV